MVRPQGLIGAFVPLSLAKSVLAPSFITQAFGLCVAFVAQVAIARAIGASGYGAFSLVMAVASGSAVFARFGWDATIMRFGGPMVAGGRDEEIALLFDRAKAAVWRMSMPTSVIVLIASVFALYLGRASASAAEMILGVLLIPVIAHSGLRSAVLLAMGRVWAAFVPEYVLRPLLMLTGGALLLVVRDAGAGTAMAIALIASTAALTAGQFFVDRIMPRTRSARLTAEVELTWSTNARSTTIFNGSYQLLAYADIVVAGFVLSAADLGYYAAARTLASIGTFGLVAFQVSVSPRIAAALANGDATQVRQITNSVARMAGLFAVSYGLCLAVIGQHLLSLFGPGFGLAYPALAALLMAQILNASAGPLGAIVTMSGLQREASAAYALAAAVLVITAVVLAKWAGLLGVALAVMAATLTWTVMISATVSARLGYSVSVLPSKLPKAPGEKR